MEGGGGAREFTLRSVLGKERDESLRVNRTLLDIIRQEEPNCRVYENAIDSHQENKKGWKFFKEKRHLKRASDGDVWAGGIPVPVSDVGFRDGIVSTSNVMVMGSGSESNQKSVLAQLLRARSLRAVEQVQVDDDSGEMPWAETGEVQSLNQYLSRVWSSREIDVNQENTPHIEHVPVSNARVPAVNLLTRSLSRLPSGRLLDVPVSSVRLSEALAAEREHMQMVLSTTEATRSAQDEADATETNSHSQERAQIDAEVANEQPQVRMSLSDLLEDTDSRQLGWSSYSGDVYDHTGNIDEGNDYVEEEGSNFVEQTCCVCMVRHKGSAFIPCGHTFCRFCSRKLWVNRGNCPICNGFILEILDIF